MLRLAEQRLDAFEQQRVLGGAGGEVGEHGARLVTSAGPNAVPSRWCGPAPARDCSSPIATSGAATIDVGRRWRLSASLGRRPGPAASARLRAASATSDSALVHVDRRARTSGRARLRGRRRGAAACRRRRGSAAPRRVGGEQARGPARRCARARARRRRLETAPRLSTSASRNAAWDTSSPRSLRPHCSEARSRSGVAAHGADGGNAQHGDHRPAREQRRRRGRRQRRSATKKTIVVSDRRVSAASAAIRAHRRQPRGGVSR